jgi:phage-related protein
MKAIIFYKTQNDVCPVEDFLDTLPDKDAQKVAWVLKAIKELNPIPAQYFRKLTNTSDIWEVRVSFANNIYRLLGFFEKNDFIILTNGFQKKTQKTPKQEIELAEERKKEYLKRRHKNG